MSFLKKIVDKILTISVSSKESIEKHQKKIRDYEWSKIQKFIPKKSRFLDVGCGSGYSLFRAFSDLNCEVIGIDPAPGEHGVGRFLKDDWEKFPIQQGRAESLPFDDNNFDVVYSSHVLEHVESEIKALNEMSRVLKKEGVLIIGMPTATMSLIGGVSHIIFTSHISLYHLIKSIGKKDFKERLLTIFIPRSHSYPRAKYILYDFQHYKVKNWKRIVQNNFEILEIITPALYPYPDFIQWFPWIKDSKYSSSVFFICKNK